MKEIDYVKPKSISEALEILEEKKGNAKIIAGGTDLLVRLKQNTINENIIVDIGDIESLKGIYLDDHFVHILPLTTHSEILESDIVKNHGFILWQACKTIGSPEIRNRATIGGNIANASPAGDSITALFVHEASLKLISKRGERIVNIEEFFNGPGKTILDSDELILEVIFPRKEENEVGFFKKIGQRKGIAISIINVAAKLRISGKYKFDKAIVAFGAVAPTVVRGKLIEKALLEETVDSPEKILYISRLAFREVSPISDIRGSLEYRRDMSTNLLYEGLLEIYMNYWG